MTLYFVMDSTPGGPDYALVEASTPDEAATKFESLSEFYVGNVLLVAEVKIKNDDSWGASA